MPEKITGKVVVTGAAGFIGSQIAARIRPESLILIDKLSLFKDRGYNPSLLRSADIIEAEDVFFEALPSLGELSWVIHMGAITNTAETDLDALKKWNVDYSKTLWNYCTQKEVNFLYASSAATYGRGDKGFSDDHSIVPKLEPLNPYGMSKQEFDLWVLEQIKKGSTPPNFFGLKFFNVFGPNEGHKGAMSSSIWHGLNEIQRTGAMTLFKSHNPKFKDGEQARDFIFIDDILQIIDFIMAKKPESGIYNCGTGRAGTFLDVATCLFESLDRPLKINWIDTPEQYRKAYQYRTEASVDKLNKIGYTRAFTPLIESINKYLFRIGAKTT
jgi:ADP-L-glycero-D-manno-heptose 6-epimerase